MCLALLVFHFYLLTRSFLLDRIVSPDIADAESPTPSSDLVSWLAWQEKS